MTTETQVAAASKTLLWSGGILTAIAVLFLAFDGITKLLKVPAVVKASHQLGLPASATTAIGIVLLACTAVYANPRTAVLGALLLTAYLGGAVAIHVRAESGLFPIVFSIGFGILVWAGLLLREPRLLRTILFRQ